MSINDVNVPDVNMSEVYSDVYSDNCERYYCSDCEYDYEYDYAYGYECDCFQIRQINAKARKARELRDAANIADEKAREALEKLNSAKELVKIMKPAYNRSRNDYLRDKEQRVHKTLSRKWYLISKMGYLSMSSQFTKAQFDVILKRNDVKHTAKEVRIANKLAKNAEDLLWEC